MAYNELLADRIRFALDERKVTYTEKEMMGSLAFMVDEKMCLGIVKEQLMARIGPDAYEAALKKEGCKEMDFTGRKMNGYVFVEPEAMDREDDLADWVQLCLAYNPIAKAARKRMKRKSPKVDTSAIIEDMDSSD
jgi:TfoX/Sxy family transcriptional regulator of competence genes